MSENTFPSIPNDELTSRGVSSLADRPNNPSQYGTGSLTASQLKARFDNIATLIANKFNKLGEDFSSGAVLEYISVNGFGEDIESLKDFLDAIVSGTLADILVAQVLTLAGGGTLTKTLAQRMADLSVCEGKTNKTANDFSEYQTYIKGQLGEYTTDGKYQTTVKGRISVLNNTLNTLISRVNAAETNIAEAKAGITGLTSQVGTLEGDATREKQRVEEIQNELDEVSQKTSALDDSLTTTNSEVDKLKTGTKILFDSSKRVYCLYVGGKKVSELDVITKGIVSYVDYDEDNNQIVFQFGDGTLKFVSLAELVDVAMIEAILEEKYDPVVTETVSNNPVLLRAEKNSAQSEQNAKQSESNAKASEESALASKESAFESRQASETAKAKCEEDSAKAESAKELAEQSAERARESAEQIERSISGLPERVNAVEKRLYNLETATSYFETDNSVAYRKFVPEGTLPYAAIGFLGGKTTVIDGVINNASVGSLEIVGANLFDKSKVNATETETGFSFTNAGSNGSPKSIGLLKDIAPQLRVGDRVTYHAYRVNAYESKKMLYLQKSAKEWYAGSFITVTQNDLDSSVYAYGLQNELCEFQQMRIVRVKDTPYSPYTVTAFLIPEEVQSIDGYGWGTGSKYYNHILWQNNRVYFVKMVERVVMDGVTAGRRVAYYGSAPQKFGSFEPQKKNLAGEHSWEHPTLIFNGGVGIDNIYVANAYSIAMASESYSSIEEWNAMLQEQYAAGNPVTIYYPLAEPEVTDITDIFFADSFIIVESGGVITAVNDNQLDVPSSITFQIKKEASV